MLLTKPELQVLRTKAENAVEGEILEDGMIAVAKDAVILKEGQKAVDADAVILGEGQKLVDANAVVLETDVPVIKEPNQKPQEEIIDRNNNGLGADSPEIVSLIHNSLDKEKELATNFLP